MNARKTISIQSNGNVSPTGQVGKEAVTSEEMEHEKFDEEKGQAKTDDKDTDKSSSEGIVLDKVENQDVSQPEKNGAELNEKTTGSDGKDSEEKATGSDEKDSKEKTAGNDENESKEKAETGNEESVTKEVMKPLKPKKWTWEQIEEFLVEKVGYLKSLTEEDYVLPEVKCIAIDISTFYFNYRSKRCDIANKLLSLEFPAFCKTALVYYNKIGIFKSDSTWFPAYYFLNTAWNYSDASLPFCVGYAQVGFVALLTANISHQPYLDNLSSKNVTYVTKSSLSILHNLARDPASRPYFDEADTKNLLQPFLSSENEFFKAISTMLLALIINEDENYLLEDSGAITYIVAFLQKALGNKKTRRCRGFSPDELTECLNRMAINDTNKTKIVEAGTLPLLVSMLEGEIEEENRVASRALWTLAFHKETQKHILDEVGCMNNLEKLTESPNSKVRQNASGALWILKEEQNKHSAQVDEKLKGNKSQHIFISYAWYDQEMVLQIHKKLKSEGFNVWIDVEQMGGSTLEAMASAVENASVVIICASERYKLSPNARTEAEYTFQLKRPIVPLMMQRKYKPDGWLGMLLGSKFYVNFDGKYEFDEAYIMLNRELAGRSKDGAQAVEEMLVATVSQPLRSAPPSEKLQCHDWDKDKVQSWLEEKEVPEEWRVHFTGYTGKLLSRFAKMERKAPEIYYRHLSEKVGLEMLEILQLTEILSQLDK